MNKIPVIGTAVMKNPHWVERLYKSIDYPVENFIIFNNNLNGEIVEDLEKIKKINNDFVENFFICHLPTNLGVSCAWNLIIKSYINSPYWIIVNDDVAFTDGVLQEMAFTAEDKNVAIIHGSEGDFSDGSWDLFLLKDFVVQKCGLFDENLTPAYCEDSDYRMRFVNFDFKRYFLSKPYLHGTGLNTDYYTHGSQTKKSSVELENKLNLINIINFEYMTEKWGKGWRMTYPQALPFNKYPISYTSFDLDFIRRKSIIS